ncbi:MAG: ParB/RepB/Spo0J family partition protein [Oscillospiraceae bacterium]|jgi:ParB family chromosome partitioning protein|nr:ParB/RepB/Spo0J family partition protein [Oscillospiraceae bacterium]
MLFQQREKVVNRVLEIPIELVKPNPHNPRTSFDEEELSGLAESIRQNGLLQPLTVRRKDDCTYELIAGERRLRAVRMLGLETISCIVVDMSDKNASIMALVENIQRKDLSFFDEALALQELIDVYGLTQEDTAIKLGFVQSTVANKLRLLKLTDEERSLIVAARLTERHARALLRLKNTEERLIILKQIIKQKLNVEKSERLIDNFLTKQKIKADFAKKASLFKDVRLFINTINKAVDTMKAVGIPANSTKIQNENSIEYRIIIPLEKVAKKA